MAICSWCNKEMNNESVVSCSGNLHVEFPDGQLLLTIPFTDPDKDKRCHDCNVAVGGFHHPGCDMEECPRCGGQLISCGCLDDEEG